jgi:hypothetical protein
MSLLLSTWVTALILHAHEPLTLLKTHKFALSRLLEAALFIVSVLTILYIMAIPGFSVHYTIFPMMMLLYINHSHCFSTK